MSNRPKPSSGTKVILLKAVGLMSLVLGFVGLFLPLMPTTPFILLSGWCFARSSPEWHRWIHHHREFGPLIENWNRDRSISRRHKAVAIGIISLSLISIWLFSPAAVPLALRIALTGGLATVATFLFLAKTS